MYFLVLTVTDVTHAAINPDGSVTFEASGPFQFESSFLWGQPLPNMSSSTFALLDEPGYYSSGTVATTHTMTYRGANIATHLANYVNTTMSPICGGEAVSNGNNVTMTTDGTRCVLSINPNYPIYYEVTTNGGWANCKSTILSPRIKRSLTSPTRGVISSVWGSVSQSRNFDSDGVLLSGYAPSQTIPRGGSGFKVSTYDTTVELTESLDPNASSNTNMMTCKGTRYLLVAGVTSTGNASVFSQIMNGYIVFSSGINAPHLRLVSGSLPSYGAQQVNNRQLAPELNIHPSANIDVGGISGLTYPDWHEYPIQITATSDVTYNMVINPNYPVLVSWTCLPPTGNVEFEIRNTSGISLCGAAATTHRVTSPLDVRAAWRPSFSGATGVWSATATVTYTLP